jgi:glutamate synthase domain-containing protein 1
MTTTQRPAHMRPEKQGLYDPRFEHDACGLGFVANIKGRKSHRILEQAIEVLKNLDHRGACGCEVNTGDGAGVLIQMPHLFNEEVCRKARIALPPAGEYGSGIVFLPRNPTVRRQIEQKFEQVVQSEGQHVIGWRTVPTVNGMLGETARSCEPFMRQVFIKRDPSITDELAFERKLYVIRKRAYNEIRTSTLAGAEYWYVVSLSCRTFVYKGMLLTTQLDQYFPDLHNPLMETALALVHSRFSTNTFPSWDRAHPYRYIAHNGEINTLRGNINWMHAREALLRVRGLRRRHREDPADHQRQRQRLGHVRQLLELLYLVGRSLPHAMMMMIPEPWSNHESMDAQARLLPVPLEPDGAVGRSGVDRVHRRPQIGAVLDRNGLRPSRYYVTKDDLVILASEAGVLDVPPETVLRRAACSPAACSWSTPSRAASSTTRRSSAGRHERPYREWLDEHLVHLEGPAGGARDARCTRPGHLLQRQIAFGYTFEDLRMILTPMARDGVEAVGSMGNDTPLAVLSNKPRLLYDYFKQLFAQVTNPPIDCIREELSPRPRRLPRLGRQPAQPAALRLPAHRAEVAGLTNEEFAKIRRLDLPGLASACCRSCSASPAAARAW